MARRLRLALDEVRKADRAMTQGFVLISTEREACMIESLVVHSASTRARQGIKYRGSANDGRLGREVNIVESPNDEHDLEYKDLF
jgi:hypothetical protein